MKPWYVYIVECNDGTLYTGIAVDVDARIEVHNKGKGAKYTKPRLPVSLLYLEECGNQSKATSREYAIKKLSRTKKLRLIKGQKYE